MGTMVALPVIEREWDKKVNGDRFSLSALVEESKPMLREIEDSIAKVL